MNTPTLAATRSRGLDSIRPDAILLDTVLLDTVRVTTRRRGG
jgi:hypothetical protein